MLSKSSKYFLSLSLLFSSAIVQYKYITPMIANKLCPHGKGKGYIWPYEMSKIREYYEWHSRFGIGLVAGAFAASSFQTSIPVLLGSFVGYQAFLASGTYVYIVLRNHVLIDEAHIKNMVEAKQREEREEREKREKLKNEEDYTMHRDMAEDLEKIFQTKHGNNKKKE